MECKECLYIDVVNTAGILCPACDHDGACVLNWVKDDGYLIGMRLVCMSCEHRWTYYNDDP